jgi:OmpA-OmpF porin, OOP family
MKRLLALGFVVLPLAAAGADNYLGVLKPPQSSLAPTGLYSFATGPTSITTLSPENGYRLKLGYKYSRFLSVEGEFSDFARPSDIFANPASLTSAFRSTGFAVDTVATLPVWRFSFYGRLGAYHGDRNGFNTYSTTLLESQAGRGTRWRYGLGVRYDITKALGIRAELERYSTLGLGSPFAGDMDSDQVTVGVSWRF